MEGVSYFTAAELEGLDSALVKGLLVAREVANVPFVITSGRRTVAENTAAGGVRDSSHERGLAVDLACTDARARYRILKGLFAAGFHRIGAYDLHVHADVDVSLPAEVVWLGVSH